MSLQNELNLIKPIALKSHEAILNIYFTAACLKKKADLFFKNWNLTDVQFNLLMILHHQADPEQGFTQTKLSEMLLVNKANITSLIDRMEKSCLVERRKIPGDRRSKRVILSDIGKELITHIEPLYIQEVERIMRFLTDKEKDCLIGDLEQIRHQL